MAWGPKDFDRVAHLCCDPHDAAILAPAARSSRFGGPLALSKLHWVRPELVAEITCLTWTDEPLLRHTVFVGLRDDKPAREVRREVASSVARLSSTPAHQWRCALRLSPG
jgi:ATP-dependent DNA ligase